MSHRNAHPVILLDDLREELERGGCLELVLPTDDAWDAATWRVFVTTADGVRRLLIFHRRAEPYEIKTPRGLFSFLRGLGIEEFKVPVPPYDRQK